MYIPVTITIKLRDDEAIPYQCIEASIEAMRSWSTYTPEQQANGSWVRSPDGERLIQTIAHRDENGENWIITAHSEKLEN